MRRFVKDGTVKTFALWNPADLGYVGAALASGQITGAQGEKFKAGKLGEYTVGEKGVVLGPRPCSTAPTSTSSSSDPARPGAERAPRPRDQPNAQLARIGAAPG